MHIIPGEMPFFRKPVREKTKRPCCPCHVCCEVDTAGSAPVSARSREAPHGAALGLTVGVTQAGGAGLLQLVMNLTQRGGKGVSGRDSHGAPVDGPAEELEVITKKGLTVWFSLFGPSNSSLSLCWLILRHLGWATVPKRLVKYYSRCFCVLVGIDISIRRL